MSLYTYVFHEASPNTATTAASAGVVDNAANYLAAGVAGPFDDTDGTDVYAELVGATGGTLDVFLQVSPDEGANFYDAIHFPQLAAGGAAVIYRATLAYAQQNTTATQGAPIVIGKNLTPLLAVNTVVPGEGFNRARLVFKSGAGTSAGAAIRVVLCSKRDWGR
jgi:hypothetical protein